MTFAEILTAIYRDTGYPDVPLAAPVLRFKGWVNEGHRHILRLPGLVGLRQGTSTFASVASQKSYGLPLAFERVDSITDPTTMLRLRYMSRDEFRSVDPGETSTGPPYRWIPDGLGPVMIQPASTGLWVVSSAGGDTTQSAYVQGLRANGDPQTTRTAALNGTTRVSIGTFTDYSRVLMFNISAVGVGAISLFDAAAAGNELARIPIGYKAVQYQQVRLWPTATSVITYTVDGQIIITDLVQDTDVPLFPVSYHDLLSDYGRMCEYRRVGNISGYTEARGVWTDGVKKLRAFVSFPSGYRPVPHSQQSGYSQLGPWYPAGS